MELVKFLISAAVGYIGASLVFHTVKAYQGYGGGTVAVTGGTIPTAGNYDESKVIPCVTGNC